MTDNKKQENEAQEKLDLIKEKLTGEGSEALDNVQKTFKDAFSNSKISFLKKPDSVVALVKDQIKQPVRKITRDLGHQAAIEAVSLGMTAAFMGTGVGFVAMLGLKQMNMNPFDYVARTLVNMVSDVSLTTPEDRLIRMGEALNTAVSLTTPQEKKEAAVKDVMKMFKTYTEELVETAVAEQAKKDGLKISELENKIKSQGNLPKK